MVLHRWLVLVVASAGFIAAGDLVGAEEASGLGQPSNQIGLVHDHEPVKYAGHVLYFVEGYTTEEVAQALDLSRKTVGRALAAFAERANKRSERFTVKGTA